MKIFWRKEYSINSPLTNDEIFKEYKFTNVYRVLDRVSQYLISKVIYNGNDYNEEDLVTRILIFKIFNKIETWQFLEDCIGEITYKTFNPSVFSKLLSERIRENSIYNNAYMMTGSHSMYNQYESKHEKWLNMLSDEILNAKFLKEIQRVESLEELYLILNTKSFIGEFLGYQYAIDLNYSPLFNFSEDSFVKAGIGAKLGLIKCFPELSIKSFEHAILYTQENLEKYQNEFGFTDFQNLFGRTPTLIDIQNCFCETDKYLRVKVPELLVGNKRIKQKYKANKSRIRMTFPPKWNLNQTNLEHL